MLTIFTFLRGLMANPRSMGAVIPSSDSLARAMTRHIDIEQPGYVVELGPGTGVITKALLNTGIKAQRVIALELAPHFAKQLKAQFPAIAIIQGSATQLSEFIEQKPVQAIISSLPLRSLSKENREKILLEIPKVLAPNGLFIQFTYALHDSHDYDPENLKLIDSFIVWRNFPPARVSVFRKTE